MAAINLTIKSDFKAASEDLKKFGDVTEAQRKKIEKFQKEFKDENVKQFTDRTNRATAAIKATRGPVAALTSEYRSYQREIERLIKRGLDPQDDAIKELTDSYQKLEKEIAETTKEQKRSQQQTERNEKAMKALKFGAIAAGVALTKAFIDFSKESVEAASEAEEIAGKYGVVFRELEDGGESMAESLADDFDLASSTAQKLLGDTGDLLTGFGLSAKSAAQFADETNRLALDLASFTNAQGGAEAVSKALTSAYANEREALKTYGIVINQAMVDARRLEDAQRGLTFESEKEAIAFATLSLATEQSKNAIGDYARTADSAANVEKTLGEQIKRSKENWGALVNEGLTPVRRAFRDFLKDLNDAEEASRNLDDALEGVAGADLEEAIKGQEKLLKEATDYWSLFLNGREEDKIVAQNAIKAEQDKLDILKERLDMQLRINGQRAIADSIADALLKKQEEEAAALAESAKWTEMRQEAEAELLISLQEIAETEKLSKELNKEYNAESERAAAVWKTINDLRKQGFTVEGAGIQKIIDKYGKYVKVLSEVEESNDEIIDTVIERERVERLTLESITDMAIRSRDERIQAAEETAEAWEDALGKIESAAKAGIGLANAATGDFNDLLGEVGSTLTQIGQKTNNVYLQAAGLAVEITSEIIEIFKTIEDQEDALKDLTLSVEQEIAQIVLDERLATIESTYDAEVKSLQDIEDAKIKAYLDTLSEKERQALRAAGVIEETEMQRIEREMQAAIDANDQETIARLENEKKLEEIRQENSDAEAEALRTYNNAIAQVEYDQAVYDKEVRIATAKAQKQSALADIPWYDFISGGKQKKKVKAAYNELIATIESINIPAAPTFQTGTGILPFTVPNSQPPAGFADNQFVRVSPGEQVEVTPRGETGGTARTMNAVFQIGESELFRVVNIGIESGDIRISRDNIQGGAAV